MAFLSQFRVVYISSAFLKDDISGSTKAPGLFFITYNLKNILQENHSTDSPLTHIPRCTFKKLIVKFFVTAKIWVKTTNPSKQKSMYTVWSHSFMHMIWTRLYVHRKFLEGYMRNSSQWLILRGKMGYSLVPVASITDYYRVGGLKQHKLFSTLLELRSVVLRSLN